MGAPVFAAYETKISIDKLTSKTDSFSIADDDSHEIDNEGNGDYFPKITITADGSVNLSSVNNNGEQLIDLDLSLSDGEVLELDFANQIYEHDSQNIINDIDFPDNKRLYLIANKINTIDFSCSGDIDVEIDYEQYESNSDESFVRSFTIEEDIDFGILKPTIRNKVINKKIQERIYNFSIGKMPINWGLYESVESEKIHRINYTEDHSSNDEYFEKCLIGVTFNSYERSFSGNDGLIMTDVSGEGMDLLTKY